MHNEDAWFQYRPGQHSCTDGVHNDLVHQGVCAKDRLISTSLSNLQPTVPFDTGFSATEEIDHGGSYDDVLDSSQGKRDYEGCVNLWRRPR